MCYATTTRKCLPRIFFRPSFRYITTTKNLACFFWHVVTSLTSTMFWHLVTSLTSTMFWHLVTFSRHWNQLRWSWRGGAHAAAVTIQGSTGGRGRGTRHGGTTNETEIIPVQQEERTKTFNPCTRDFRPVDSLKHHPPLPVGSMAVPENRSRALPGPPKCICAIR